MGVFALRIVKRLSVAVAAVTAAALVVGSNPGLAHAQTGSAYVAVGDSFVANPEIPLQIEGLINSECVRSPQGYPERVGRGVFGGNYANYSCNNATLTGVAGRGVIPALDTAHSRGDIGPATEVVTITAGGADDWNPALPGVADFGAFMGGDSVNNAAWARKMKPVISKIDQVAPNARIMVVGYPEVGNGHGAVCLANISGGTGSGSSDVNLPIPVPLRIEQFLDRVNAVAASNEHLGYEFISTDVPGTGSCAHPSDQWVRSVLDIPGAGDGLRMPVHPTALGERGVADIIASRI